MDHVQPASTPDSASPRLATPWSSHPVLDPDTQQFLDLVSEAGMHPDSLLAQQPSFPGCADSDDSCADEYAVTTEALTFKTGPTGAIDVHIVRPAGAPGSLPVVVYYPGGGWRMASFATHRRLVSRLSAEAEVAVVFVRCSPAPQAVFPTQNEEAYAALQYVVAHAEVLQLDGRAVAVAGDGAGGNIAAVVARWARDRHGPSLHLQALFCPILSADATTQSYRQFATGPGMTARALERFIESQFPERSRSLAAAMPIKSKPFELEDLPAALVITAENDITRDDAEEYARKLLRAGVRVNAARYIGTIHDFMVFDGLADTCPTDAAFRHASSVIKRALRR
ncbi:alpha/beta hydrolase [Paraburkholderia atlantica]|uniref:Alpha/beta hydrolase fold-3 domain protein n=1 Tax=Paraburkholderia atlantica TaxID=2654982 RepID=D5WDQ2_PARAM|nr:alpha/beta hydrolase [Paraburkholderia atlantica]ADG18855.1 Alpha/beta hydrolase fold-3 domain protein [Paraburkholderia atlantica]MBB5505121.1 acetyl esterase [Paraburkholderia atlantica]